MRSVNVAALFLTSPFLARARATSIISKAQASIVSHAAVIGRVDHDGIYHHSRNDDGRH